MRWLSAVPVLLFLAIGVYLYQGLGKNPEQLPSTLLDKPMPTFQIPQLDSPVTAITDKNIIGDQDVALVNFFASWCGPCRAENPFLMQIARNYRIVGINYRDKEDKVKDWLHKDGNPYALIGKDSGRMAIDWGVYGIPETFLIDKTGHILYRYPGPLNQTVWEKNFLPLIRSRS